MAGWIKLHREILENEIWYDIPTYRLFNYLLLKAAHKDGIRTGGVVLKRGQWVRSYRKLAQDLAYRDGRGLSEYSLNTIKRCVHKLMKDGRITVHDTEYGTLFTIINYAKYQDSDEV